MQDETKSADEYSGHQDHVLSRGLIKAFCHVEGEHYSSRISSTYKQSHVPAFDMTDRPM